MTFLQAIAEEEGFNVAGSRPERNNNPGDLIYGNEAIRFGATHGDPRFAVFPDAVTGWNALRRWLSIPAVIKDGQLVGGYLGATVQQVIGRFAPPGENDTNSYVSNVCRWANVTPQTIVTVAMLQV